MAIYIALLRGINVSGHNKVKMVELRHMLETMGLSRVQTYIQTGNILFESAEDTASLRFRIEDEIRKTFGISITVVLRTSTEFEAIIEHCPYTDVALGKGESVHVSILTEEPQQKVVELLLGSERDNDEYYIHGREIYFLFRQSILDSKLAKNLQKLGNTATTRNWNTINKLAALLKAMQA
ncbi:cytoplasmic protein [Bacillus sp. AFS018417]|uniref:DUF1697 domain-containing protein n=1 Tax=Bacillus sp. AFS018417 TaxID=2033491 RepID=UPI000BFA0C92|nr:DUF1697 domain-containing protein [Bacillus sp. AFS018417]PEZ04131.1 cytoplasmic protein [Bacillus sp. AFS018417]